MEIKKVGVVGCGAMGGGIAQLCSQSGYQVVVSEINDGFLKKGLAAIDKTLSRSVEKGKLSSRIRMPSWAALRAPPVPRILPTATW